MRVLVYGAGAVGGALAVRLSVAGTEVAVVARGEHAAAIRSRGLTLDGGGETRTVALRCVEDPDALGFAPDVVFVTVKQTQMPAIAAPLARLQAAGATLVLAMNGIGWWFAQELPIADRAAFVDELDPGGRLRAVLDASRLVAAVVQSSSEVVAPGVILATTPTRNRMILGSVVPGSDRRVPGICGALQRAGYESYEVQDIRREIWNKMALWLAVSPIAALTGLTLDRIIDDAGGFAVMTALLRETNAIGRRLGFELADDAEARVGYYRDKPTKPSLLKDFELGREPELASGVFVFAAIAEALGVEVPHLATMTALIRLKARSLRATS